MTDTTKKINDDSDVADLLDSLIKESKDDLKSFNAKMDALDASLNAGADELNASAQKLDGEINSIEAAGAQELDLNTDKFVSKVEKIDTEN